MAKRLIEEQSFLVAEAARWPGVAISFARTGRHIAAVVSYAGRSRKVVISASCSDTRGRMNARSDLRRELQRLGAKMKGKG